MEKDFPEKRRKLLLTANLNQKVLPVAFFDADNTLRFTRSGKPSPHGRHDVELFRQCRNKLLELGRQGFLLAIVSNQAGITNGYISFNEVEEAFQETLRRFFDQGIVFHYYDFADKKDENRKPDTGMAWRLERKLNYAGRKIDWQKSFMVGDAGWKKGKDLRPDGRMGTDHSSSDRLFAENIAKRHAGFTFFHANDFFK